MHLILLNGKIKQTRIIYYLYDRQIVNIHTYTEPLQNNEEKTNIPSEIWTRQ